MSSAKRPSAREHEQQLQSHLSRHLPALKSRSDFAHSSNRNDFTLAEIDLAYRCHGAHLELMKRDITPVGSHYQLNHYDVPIVDEKSFVLHVGGSVNKQLRLTVDELKKRPHVTEAVLLECAGNGRVFTADRLWTHVPWMHGAFGCARWTGTPLRGVLEEAGLRADAVELLFTGLDRGAQGGEIQFYRRSLPLADALRDEVLLCWAMNDQPLVPAHGAPLRLIVPGWYGFTSVKWLASIEAIAKPFDGHQMRAYSYAVSAHDTEAVRMRYNRVRALMVPPGDPDFFTRVRFVEPGEHLVVGRAWVGHASVVKVEFSADDCKTWHEAKLDKPVGPHAWHKWSYLWKAPKAGRFVLACRATDSNGFTQQGDVDDFNYFAMGCNAPQRVQVIVTPVSGEGEVISFDADVREQRFRNPHARL